MMSFDDLVLHDRVHLCFGQPAAGYLHSSESGHGPGDVWRATVGRKCIRSVDGLRVVDSRDGGTQRRDGHGVSRLERIG
jgi:hypothetical protein